MAARIMLHGLSSCSPGEVAAQACYLDGTPVWRLALDLRSGRRRLSAATIVSLCDLASLPTIFGDIGGLRATPDSRRVTFTVSEVLPLLRCHPSADPNLLRGIETLMTGDAAGVVEYNATILRSRDRLMLVDGNKRTVGFYERRRGGEDGIAYPVFVIDG